MREHAIERARNRAIRQLERLGHKVTLDQLPKAAYQVTVGEAPAAA